MHILLIYHQKPRQQRKAIAAHLQAFGRQEQHPVVYWNIAYGDPPLLNDSTFNAILFHFTFFLPNINKPFDHLFKSWPKLKKTKIYKAAMVQDEYIHSTSLCHFMKEFGVSEIFTCLPESLWQTVYPSAFTGIQHYHTVLTGYIDEDMISKYSNYALPHEQRSLDVAYRARKMPFNLGSFGTYKWRLTEIFSEKLKNSHLKTDLSNDPNRFIFGEDWYRFVGSTRTMLGCEGGSSLHDPDGSIRKCCENYQLEFPDADFETVESHCFPGLDGKFPYYALSPRHFEAAVSKTCQVLIEGDYNGIFQSGVHYISIAKDWSNLEEVIQKINDREYCEKIAERAYADIVASGLYTYPRFVETVFHQIQLHLKVPEMSGQNASATQIFKLFHQYPWLYSPFLYSKAMVTEWAKRAVWFLGLDRFSWFKKLEQKLFGSIATR
ncbi:MAG: glycosyltransferase family 1 protein [Saprospiraceae bacterium]|nr:glycosyltransferase family 1 protein [Saprospiraceae bacterium]